MVDRAVPPLPQQDIAERVNGVMTPIWRVFWTNLLLWAQDISSVTPDGPALAAGPSYANDAAAAAGGVPIGGFYRNGSVVQVRVT